MNANSTPPVPPPGEREEYICKFDRSPLGFWILKRCPAVIEAFQSAIVSGMTIAEAMEKEGGIFYAFDPNKLSQPLTEELLDKVEAAYRLLEEDQVAFWEALKTAYAGTGVWSFIISIDPWFRPRGTGGGTILLLDKDGPGLWMFEGDASDKLNAQNDRKSGIDTEASMKELGGVYYKRAEDLPETYRRWMLADKDVAE